MGLQPAMGASELYCAYVAFAKIRSQEQTRWAAKHNLREIEAEQRPGGRIDVARCGLNERLAGRETAAEVVDLAKSLMAAAGILRTRSNQVWCLEFMISLPAEHRIDERCFFTAALNWLERRFGGGDNVLSAVVHRDEAHPHMHVLVLPLIEGKLRGSDAIGGPPKVAAFYREFDEQVAVPSGLNARPRVRKLSKPERERAVADVFAELRRRQDSCLSSALWPSLRGLIAKDPEPHAVALGLKVQRIDVARRMRSSTAIFISPGKGSRRREEVNV